MFLCCLGILIALPQMSFAQRSSEYVPPPMFDDPPLPPAGAQSGGTSSGTTYTPPSVRSLKSTPDDAKPDPDFAPYVPDIAPPPMQPVPIDKTPAQQGMVVKSVLPIEKPPLPKKKPAVPAPQQVQATEAQSPERAETSQTPPVSQGVVKGPKTMPAVPARSIETLPSAPIEAVPQTSETLMERFQSQAAPSAAPPAQQLENIEPPPQFSAVADTNLFRAEIKFTADQADIPASSQSFLKNITAYLQANPSKKLDILGFAQTAEGNEAQEKRISLARAMAVRQTLIDQGLGTERINVRALGRQTDQSPKNRVDIYIKE